MNALSTVVGARIFTTSNSVLYVDGASGELRHGPIQVSPANVHFVPETGQSDCRRGWLIRDRAETRERIVCQKARSGCASGEPRSEGAATPTLLELVPLERGLMAFRAGGLFLSAEPDGRITLSRPVCSTWECFLASEDWCAEIPAVGPERTADALGVMVDRKKVARLVINPLYRTQVNRNTKATKVAFFGPLQWSVGRVNYDLCKYLYKHGCIADILYWRGAHGSYINNIITYYDFIISSLEAIGTLVDIYGVPYDKIIGIAHYDLDLQKFIDAKGLEAFHKLAGYGVVGNTLLWSSLTLGVPIVPKIVPLGVNFVEFQTDISEQLSTAGYATGLSGKTKHGLEWKRGDLAQECADEAGLKFKRAGEYPSATDIHDMPDFYKSVDAVLMTSLTEAGGLPGMEAAAAGRLVIGTPVGHFPVRAYQGGGIVAPLEREKFKRFAVETLCHYKADPPAYVAKCRKIQEAAKQFDWEYVIGDWIELIEMAKKGSEEGGEEQRLARGSLAAAFAEPKSDRLDADFLEKVSEECRIFEEIYAKSKWGQGQGSGSGSHPAATSEYRAFLEQFIVMNEVTSIVDVGCGDWRSSRHISFNGARYTGFDVVKSVVDVNRATFGSDLVSFAMMPVDPRDLPNADLLIIKDVLQHFTNEQILFYRDHVVPKYPLCLITNSWKAINYPQNGDIAPGQFRSLELKASPYLFNGAYVTESWHQWERIRTLLLINKPPAKLHIRADSGHVEA